MRDRDSFIIINPYDPDAQGFIAAMSAAFGMRPICVFTDPQERFYLERALPWLTTEDPELEVPATPDQLGDIAKELSTRYNIRAVVPFREHYVEWCAAMLEHLEVDWMSGADLALFRDKNRLKHTITDRDPSIRVPYSRIVRSLEDVFDPAPPDAFVLKPNDGAGSENLGFFSADNRQAVADHLANAPDVTWILEERIDGPEFRINGLIRRDGTMQILYVSEYVPLKLSETFTLGYSTEIQLKTDDARWPELVGYAERILRTAGAWGTPFHLEVKVDDQGPAIIDLGTRLPSDGGAWLMNMLHPDRPDVYAVAARDYLGDNHFAHEAPNYEFYDGGLGATVSGVARTDGHLTAIEGLEEVEAHPHFLRWIAKPQVGDRIYKTVDLRTCPYIATFRHEGSRDDTIAFRDWMYETLVLHTEEDVRPWSSTRRNQTLEHAQTLAAWRIADFLGSRRS